MQGIEFIPDRPYSQGNLLKLLFSVKDDTQLFRNARSTIAFLEVKTAGPV